MFEFFVTTYGSEIIGMLILSVFGCLGYAAKQICKRFLDDETKRAIAMTAVRFVEQCWKTLHGADKLAKALETAEILLKKKGIDFDAEEMMYIIEAAVAEMNDVFNKTTEQHLPVKAGDYVGPQDSGEAEKVTAEMA